MFEYIMGFGLVGIILMVVIFLILLVSLRVFYEYERGVLLTLGKFSKVLAPGLRVVIPLLQEARRVDMRLTVVDIPEQDAITRDNVTVKVNAVLYYKVFDAKLAILKVEEYNAAVSLLAQTTMRNVVGETTLDNLLGQRDQISKRLKEIVDKATDVWGINIESVDMKRIELPEDMKRVMAKGAEAERIKRATVIRSEGEALAAEKVAHASHIISSVPGGLHLRTLQSLNDIASDPSNVINFFVPLDVLESYEGYASTSATTKRGGR